MDEDDAIAMLLRGGVLRIYRMRRWCWILDGAAWNAAWKSIGQPESDFSERHGILILDTCSVDAFVAKSSRFELSASQLRQELLFALSRSDSWWNVEPLFPKMLIDFDRRRLTACYDDGHPSYENYIPAGWTGEYLDFMQRVSPDVLPVEFRYWLRPDGTSVIDQLRTD